MVENFNPQKINLGGPVFDQRKLVWFNQQHIRRLTPEEFIKYMNDPMLQFPNVFNERFFARLFELFQPRLEYLGDFWPQAQFFFASKVLDDYQEVVPKGRSVAEICCGLRLVVKQFEKLSKWSWWNPEKIKESLQWAVTVSGLTTKELYIAVRLLITGTKKSPDLAQTIYLLGSRIVIHRLREYLAAKDDK